MSETLSKTCPTCGRQLPAATKFCPGCGTKQPESPAPGAAQGAVPGAANFCPSCGEPVAAGATCCTHCGRQLNTIPAPGPATYPDPGTAYPGDTASGPGGGAKPGAAAGILKSHGDPRTVAGFCSGGIFLIATALLSLGTLMNLVFNFGLVTILGSVPMAIICIGLCQTYLDLRNGPYTKGLHLTGTGLFVGQVYGLVLPVLIALMAIFLLAISDGEGSVIAVALIILLFDAVFALLVYQYWKQLRNTVAAAERSLMGERVSIPVTLYPIVILAINGVGTLIAATGVSTANNAVKALLSTLSSASALDDSSRMVLNFMVSNFLPENTTLLTLSYLVLAAGYLCTAAMLNQFRELQKPQPPSIPGTQPGNPSNPW